MNNVSNYISASFTHFIWKWLKSYQFHFLAWACFIANEVAAARMIGGKFAPFLNYFIHYAINIGFFYVIALYILPNAFKIKRHLVLKFIIAFIISMVIYLTVVYCTDHILSFVTNYQFKTTTLRNKSYFAFTTVWRGIYFLGFSIGYYYINAFLASKHEAELSQIQLLEQEIREKDYLIELGEAKNAYLKAQINPHFLFNAFNTLYSKSRKHDAPVANAIISLAKIMRYAVKVNQTTEGSPIKEELEYVQYLIKFWELQNQQACAISIICTKDAGDTLFIPLVLLTLAENMLKHGALDPSDKESAWISIFIEDTCLHIQTRNLIYPEKASHGFQSGLSNISERLKHTYGDQCTLAYGVNQESNSFEVHITLAL